LLADDRIAVALQGHPKEQRVPWLRHRLKPESLLRDFDGEVYAHLPDVVLIGIKDGPSEYRAMTEVHGPAFRSEIEGDREIAAMLDDVRALGFEFEWGVYADATTTEYMLRICRNPAAEQRLRDAVGASKA
jgi:hypothetical protein